MYNDITKEFYSKDNLVLRKDNGIYMTPYNIIEKCFSDEKLKKGKNRLEILEPSFGSGQFIDIITKLSGEQNNITGIELLNELCSFVKKKYLKNKNINCICQDFLTWKTTQKFDLVVGNPPYFEMTLNQEQKKTYGHIVSGRPNIYSLFIFKSIQLLKPGGKLIFVIPTTLLSGKYFEKLRFYIKQTCNIERIDILSTNDFEDASQLTMIFCLSKLSDINKLNQNFVITFPNTIIFSLQYKNITKLIKDKKFIVDLGCDVKTGNITWNKHKKELTDNKKTSQYIPLIYSRNLVDNQILLKPDNVKKQYIKINPDTKPFVAPFIAINRIVGIKDIVLKPVLVEFSSDKYYFENHINVITGDIKDLKIIYNSLCKQTTINFIKDVIRSTQLSKNELLNVIPIL